jgi:DNA-binding NarL/FixJ family response regulator
MTTRRRRRHACALASWRATAAGGDAAASALAALAALAAVDGTSRAGVDLIIADLRLANGASGIDAIAELRSGLGMETPALIVSGDTSAAARAEVESAGIRLLLKPVVATTLREAAAAALQGRTEHRTRQYC